MKGYKNLTCEDFEDEKGIFYKYDVDVFFEYNEEYESKFDVKPSAVDFEITDVSVNCFEPSGEDYSYTNGKWFDENGVEIKVKPASWLIDYLKNKLESADVLENN